MKNRLEATNGDHERSSVRVFASYRTSAIVCGGALLQRATMIAGGTSDRVSRTAVVLTPTFRPITIVAATMTATPANQNPTSWLRVMCFNMVSTLLRVVLECVVSRLARGIVCAPATPESDTLGSLSVVDAIT